MIKCNNYIFSTNGEKHNLPNKRALAQILRNPYRDIKEQYNIYFPYDTHVLNDIFRVDGEEVYIKWNFDVLKSDRKILILNKFLCDDT